MLQIHSTHKQRFSHPHTLACGAPPPRASNRTKNRTKKDHVAYPYHSKLVHILCKSGRASIASHVGCHLTQPHVTNVSLLLDNFLPLHATHAHTTSHWQNKHIHTCTHTQARARVWRKARGFRLGTRNGW